MTGSRNTVIIGLILVVAAILAVSVLYRAYHYPMFDVRINVEGKAHGGHTLFTFTIDDIGQELTEPSGIYLVDSDGKLVHRWHVMGSVQLAKLKPNGNLLYKTRDRSFKERAGLRETDPFGNIIWYYKSWADHDFDLLPSGNILIHYIEDKPVPAIGTGDVRCPGIVEVTTGKEAVWTWRGEDHLDELTGLLGISFPLEENPARRRDGVLDWAHSNTCRVMPENASATEDSRFRAGNILISYPNFNTIGVIDKESGEIAWAWGPGDLDGQHNPVMMKNGNILIFDNGTQRGYSRVIELAPLSDEIVWEYSDRGSREPGFFSGYTSGSQPLSNGNVFVCQSSCRPPNAVARFFDIFRRRVLRKKTAWSRLFEVNRSNEVVWEMVVNRSGDDNLHEVYQATRYSEAYLRPLLEALEKARDADGRSLRSLPYVR
ncbi:MAG: aryl-sulfate sulfotransferase [Candidatus Eisenbacteria bacterium]